MTLTDLPSFSLGIGVGLGVLLMGIGVFVVCLRLTKLFARVDRTLDEVDQQLSTLSIPIAQTLTHVGGIADTADSTIARLAGVVGQIEVVAAGAVKTAGLIGSAVANVVSGFRQRDPSEPGAGNSGTT